MSWLFKTNSEPRRAAGELITDYRTRLALEEHEKAQQRQLELAEQSSSLNAPDVRIRTWERLHGLRMPADATHPILDVIAMSTHLTLKQVQEEQRARLAQSTVSA